MTSLTICKSTRQDFPSIHKKVNPPWFLQTYLPIKINQSRTKTSPLLYWLHCQPLDIRDVLPRSAPISMQNDFKGQMSSLHSILQFEWFDVYYWTKCWRLMHAGLFNKFTTKKRTHSKINKWLENTVTICELGSLL